MENNCILLCSSNFSKEYIIDILEALGRPKGSVMYVRYRKKWVDQSLWDKLSLISDGDHKAFNDLSILSIYVYQEKVLDNKTEWKFIYPIRFGKIKECYKTGNSNNDIAYFYFEVQDYCLINHNDEEDKKDLDNINNRTYAVERRVMVG